MHRVCLLAMVLGMGASCFGQAFAPPQPREVAFSGPPVRTGPMVPMYSNVNPSDSVSAFGLPLPAPTGLGGTDTMAPASGGTVFSPSTPVQIPESARGIGARLYVVPNADGGTSALLYNPGTGAVVEYNQTLQVGQLGQGVRYGQPTALILEPGVSNFQGVMGGYTNVTTDPLTGTFLAPSSGIPAINSRTPSYNYQSNQPAAPLPPPSPFGGGSFGSGVGTSAPINVTSPPP